MGIENTNCTCGEAITVLSGADVSRSFRSDGKQVIYTGEPQHDGCDYDIFRCRGCGEPIHQTCAPATYYERVQ